MNKADLEFLNICEHNGLTLKFLNFKLANNNYSKESIYI